MLIFFRSAAYAVFEIFFVRQTQQVFSLSLCSAQFLPREPVYRAKRMHNNRRSQPQQKTEKATYRLRVWRFSFCCLSRPIVVFSN